MNREMADRIIEIIKEDATGEGQMFREDGAMCVLGGLWASHTGKSCKELYQQFHPMPPNPSGLHYEPYQEVKYAYELSDGQLWDLYTTNDNCENVVARRIALIDLVESWV
jgi:hypothetical protein